VNFVPVILEGPIKWEIHLHIPVVIESSEGGSLFELW